MADEPDDDGTETTDPSPGASAGASPASSGTTASASPASPAPSTPAPAAPSAPAAPPTPATLRDWARQNLGYSEEHSDDPAMLQTLVAFRRSAAQRIQELESERLQWIRAQQPQQPAQAQPDPLAAFKGPEFNPAWLTMVEQDPITGNIRSKAGVDPSIASKLMAAKQWQADFAERVSSNPLETLQPMLQHVAKELFEKEFQTRFQGVQAQQESQQFVRDNFNWLFAHDSAGKPILNPQTQRNILSQDGQRFYGYLQSAGQLGMPAQAQQEYARAMLARDLAMPHLQNHAAATNGDAAKQKLIDDLNRRQPSTSGSTVGQGTGHPGAPQNSNLSLEERFRRDFAAEGVKADLATAD